MVNAYASFMLPEQMYKYAFPNEPRPADSEGVNNLYNTIRTRDGHVIGLVASDAQFKGLMDALDRHDLAADPRFANQSARLVHDAQLKKAVEPHAAHMSTKEFIALMHRHEVPFGPVNDFAGFFSDPQVIHNRAYVDRFDPSVGVVRTMGAFAQLSDTPSRPDGGAPSLGQHTDEVLGELGYTQEAIKRMRADQLVR